MFLEENYLNDTIRLIISNAAKSDFTEEESEKYILRVVNSGDWKNIRAVILDILYAEDRALWSETVKLIYYLQNRGFKFEYPEIVALLCDCLSLSDEIDSNLVWTIVRGVKSVSYLSDWDPFADEEILREINKINKIRQNLIEGSNSD